MKKRLMSWTHEWRRTVQPLIATVNAVVAGAEHEEEDRRRMTAVPRHERLRSERRRVRAHARRASAREPR